MRSIMTFFSILFSPVGMLFVAYVLVGVFYNTAPPHIPGGYSGIGTAIHSWVQYVISVVGWPLGLPSPTFTFGKWTGL